MNDKKPSTFNTSTPALVFLSLLTVATLMLLGAALVEQSWTLAGLAVGSWAVGAVVLALVGMAVDGRRKP